MTFAPSNNITATATDLLESSGAPPPPPPNSSNDIDSSIVEDEGDIYLDHCHHDYYCEEGIVGEDDDAAAIAMYNQFFEQQAKLTRDLHLENAKKRRQRIIAEQATACSSSSSSSGDTGSGNTSATSTACSSDSEEEDTNEEAHAPKPLPGVFSVLRDEETIKVPLKERCEAEALQKGTEALSSSPQSPSRKRQKEYTSPSGTEQEQRS